MAEAGEAGARSEALGEGGAEGEEGVFGGVVVVDCGEDGGLAGLSLSGVRRKGRRRTGQIALTPQSQTPPGMFRQRVQHMI